MFKNYLKLFAVYLKFLRHCLGEIRKSERAKEWLQIIKEWKIIKTNLHYKLEEIGDANRLEDP